MSNDKYDHKVKGDRRGARAQHVDANQFYDLHRRVGDHDNRIGMLETTAQQHSQDSFNLRQDVTAIVETNIKAITEQKQWQTDREAKLEKKEYIFSWLIFCNTVALFCCAVALTLK